MPYFTSRPTSPLASSTIAGRAARSVATPPMAYGLISRLRLAGGGSRPTSEPAADMRNIPRAPLPAPAAMGTRVR